MHLVASQLLRMKDHDANCYDKCRMSIPQLNYHMDVWNVFDGSSYSDGEQKLYTKGVKEKEDEALPKKCLIECLKQPNQVLNEKSQPEAPIPIESHSNGIDAAVNGQKFATGRIGPHWVGPIKIRPSGVVLSRSGTHIRHVSHHFHTDPTSYHMSPLSAKCHCIQI